MKTTMFKKGTSDYIKRRIVTIQGKDNYDTNDFQQSLQARFGGDIFGGSQNRTFLPIEAFDPMLDIEKPLEAIQKYKDHSTGQTIGLSKWNFPNGEAELRKCVVNGFIPNKDLYEITWVHNQAIKKRVSRFNLIFE